MNIVYISPHFPPNFQEFCVALSEQGARVLGIGDQVYDHLSPTLKKALTEYYKVEDLEQYEQLLRACGYFTHKYGKIARIESLNEYWLEKEAKLRSDFNVDGMRAEDMLKNKSKSEMKRFFQQANIPVAKGCVVKTPEDCQSFIEDVGFPVVAKPDIGVGAAHTYKINDQQELEHYLNVKPDVDYIMEEFVDGQIFSFDGLTNREGQIVFSASHCFSHGIMEVINHDLNLNYYSLRQIPKDLEEAGQRVVNAFGVKERWFHFEFFRLKDNRLIALEVNMRPPGGWTTDMFNYANDINVYNEWANIVLHNRFEAFYSRPYFCAYVGRKFNRTYVYSHEDILSRWRKQLAYHAPMSEIFQAVMGQYGYIFRTEALESLQEIIHYVQEVK